MVEGSRRGGEGLAPPVAPGGLLGLRHLWEFARSPLDHVARLRAVSGAHRRVAGWTPQRPMDIGAETSRLMLDVTPQLILGVDTPTAAETTREMDIWPWASPDVRGTPAQEWLPEVAPGPLPSLIQLLPHY